MMVLVWQALCAALMPIKLRDVPKALERYLQHLGRCSDGVRVRRAAAFMQNLRQDSA